MKKCWMTEKRMMAFVMEEVNKILPSGRWW
jgi:hypothetical protein